MGEIVHYPEEAVSLPLAVLSWEPIRSDKVSVLKGTATLHVPKWRMRLIGCPAFHSTTSGDSWVLPPSKPLIGKDGMVKRDANNRATHIAMLEFDDRATQDLFSRAAVRALNLYEPRWREGGS